MEVIPKYFVVNVHQHKNKESFYIAKGRGHIYKNGELQEVRKGMKVDISPGTSHALYTKNEPLECFVVVEGNDTDEITKLFWDIHVDN